MDSERSRNVIDCTHWLLDFLSSGAKPRRVVSGEAIKQGYTRGQLKQARKILNVRYVKADEAYLQDDFWLLTGL